MPRRSAKINHPDFENVEEDVQAEHNSQDEPQAEEGEPQAEEGESMLGLKNLRDLIFLGKLRETVDISGYKFVISTLSANQQREVMRAVMKIDQMDRILDIKPLTVSYVIESVNGVPFEDLCEDESITDPLDRKMSVVLSLQSVIIEKVYQIYEKLVESANEEVGLEDLKV